MEARALLLGDGRLDDLKGENAIELILLVFRRFGRGVDRLRSDADAQLPQLRHLPAPTR